MGDSDNQADQTSDLIQQQINQNEADLEQKRQSLFDARLSIEKSAGGLSWSPQKNTPSRPKPRMRLPGSLGEAEAMIQKRTHRGLI